MTGVRAVTDTASTPPPAAPPVCRNCGAEAPGMFCPACGQETSLALPTVRAMLREAAGRYVAFDGRMWRTLFALVSRPGFLTREYLAGRRRRYIRPGRLFLVLSIGLFALLRMVGGPTQLFEADAAAGKGDKVTASGASRKAHTDLSDLLGDVGGDEPDVQPLRDRASRKAHTDLSDLLGDVVGDEPGVQPLRDRADQFNKLTRQQQMDQIGAGMLRYGPYAMIALLPLFALLMKIVYLGRARRYPDRPRRYAAHLVFGAHNHAFLFLVVALYVLLPKGPARDIVALWAIVYLLLSMRAVYGGRWSGVVVRASIIFLVYSVFFGLVVAGLVVAAILIR